MKTFLIAILNLGVRGEWGGCGVVNLGNSPALIRHVSLALAKFFSVHCPRWNHCCVFSFHVLGCPDLRLHFSALEQMSSYALLWGDPKIEFGKSDAVVLGTNAPT